jgi:hypothetical protein
MSSRAAETARDLSDAEKITQAFMNVVAKMVRNV